VITSFDSEGGKESINLIAYHIKVAQFEGGDSISVNNELGVRELFIIFFKKGGNEWLLQEEIS
jgi:hypothetical protein